MDKEKLIVYTKKYWPFFAIIIIIILGFYVRLIDYRWPYLRNIDSYNFYREIEDIVNYGILPGYNPLLLPPYGAGVPGSSGKCPPYQCFAAYSYMFYRILSPTTQLWQFLIWFPALLAALMAIPMYFIGKLLYDRKAGILAAFFVVFDISIMSRTLGGDPDSDGIVLLMPLIVIALFLFTYKYVNMKKNIDKRGIIYSIITGIALGIWGYVWAGQWFVLWLITGFFILKIIIYFLKTRKIKNVINELKYPLISFIIIFIVYFLLTVPNLGLSFIIGSIQGPFGFGDIKSEENREFPNVYVSVAELQNPGSIKDIIQRVSAINFDANPIAILVAPFFLMIYGLIYLLYSYIKTKKHLDTLILMIIWFLGPFFATIIAIRFSILFSAPMAICSAIFLSKLIRFALGVDKKFED
ncbi:MAG: STT3 domain-containing protein [Candidatus Aenigmatarchaeota archaeon]